MAMVRILVLLIGALAVLALGASTPARAEAVAPPPCHEMVAGPRGGSGPATPAPGKAHAMAAMACCVACVAAPAPVLPGVPTPAAVPADETRARASPLRVGLSPAPEPGPPRL